MWNEAAKIRFWDALIGIYGKRFCTEHGEQMNEVWQQAVSQLSYAQAKHGLDMCLRSGDEFIPTLPQFMYRARAMPPQKTYVQLPKPSIDQATQKTRIREAVSAAKMGSGRRSILLPNESYSDYILALQASGMNPADFQNRRLEANGWTPAMEDGYRGLAHRIGYRIDP